MKKIFILALVLTAACSSLKSTEELQTSNKCQVWKDGPMGGKYAADIEGEKAKQKLNCWVMDVFVCSYIDYTFRSEASPEILSDIGDKDKMIGRFDGKKMSIDMTGLKAEPFELGKGSTEVAFKGPIGPVQKATIHHNQSCTPRQVALGIMTVLSR